MATLANNEITETWELVTSSKSLIYLHSGSCYVSYGDEPTSNQGVLLSDDERAINSDTAIATWVKATRLDGFALISVTEY